MGVINGLGYDYQQKYTICDACRLCHSILSILKPVFAKFDRFLHLQLNEVPGSPDLMIFVSTMTMTTVVIVTMTMTTQLIALPLVHARGGNNRVSVLGKIYYMYARG